MAEALSTKLVQEGHVVLTGTHKALADLLDQTVTEELSIEDRLNVEVRQMLKVYEKEIERGNVDYQKMFTMLKGKLAKERGIIL